MRSQKETKSGLGATSEEKAEGADMDREGGGVWGVGVMPALCAPTARADGCRSDCCVTNELWGSGKATQGTGMQAALIPRWF